MQVVGRVLRCASHPPQLQALYRPSETMKIPSSAVTVLFLCIFSPGAIAGNHIDISPWIMIFYPIFFALENPLLSLAFVLIVVFVYRALKRKGVLGPKAPRYNWVCPSCDEVNQANTAICSKCSKNVA